MIQTCGYNRLGSQEYLGSTPSSTAHLVVYSDQITHFFSTGVIREVKPYRTVARIKFTAASICLPGT